MSSAVLDCLSDETNDFWVEARIPLLDSPTAVQFLREAYSKYHPVIIRGAIKDWPALSKWNQQYLKQQCGEKVVSINLSADGFGDSVKAVNSKDIIDNNDTCDLNGGRRSTAESSEYFVYPAECDMTVSQFYSLIQSTDTPNIIPYLSQQNDNLRENFPCLLDDIRSLPFAEESFGVTSPEAVNL